MFPEKQNYIKESAFEKYRREKEQEGWYCMGREGLTQTKFSQEGKFEEIPFQTEDDITVRYLGAAKAQDPSSDFAIELILDENTDKLRKLREVFTDQEYRNAIDNLNLEDRSYFIFVRKIEE